MTNKLLKSLNFGGSDTYYVGWSSIQDAPFGIDYSSGETIVENKTYSQTEGAYELDFSIEPNCAYKVIVNGTEYEYISQTFITDMGVMYFVGNAGPLDMGVEDNGEPMCIVTVDMSAIGYGIQNMMVFTDGSTNDVTMTVIKYTKINKLPNVYYEKPVATIFYSQLKDEYLYKDLACTEKVTTIEFETAMYNGGVYIRIGTQVTCIPYQVVKHFDTGHIAVTFSFDSQEEMLFTSEYTG